MFSGSVWWAGLPSRGHQSSLHLRLSERPLCCGGVPPAEGLPCLAAAVGGGCTGRAAKGGAPDPHTKGPASTAAALEQLHRPLSVDERGAATSPSVSPPPAPTPTTWGAAAWKGGAPRSPHNRADAVGAALPHTNLSTLSNGGVVYRRGYTPHHTHSPPTCHHPDLHALPPLPEQTARWAAAHLGAPHPHPPACIGLRRGGTSASQPPEWAR